jgi:copper/silver efflux system protein
MAAPVLGGILVADEVIDLFLPVLFYWVRRRRWERMHLVPEVVQETAEPPQIAHVPITGERERSTTRST